MTTPTHSNAKATKVSWMDDHDKPAAYLEKLFTYNMSMKYTAFSKERRVPLTMNHFHASTIINFDSYCHNTKENSRHTPRQERWVGTWPISWYFLPQMGTQNRILSLRICFRRRHIRIDQDFIGTVQPTVSPTSISLNVLNSVTKSTFTETMWNQLVAKFKRHKVFINALF